MHFDALEPRQLLASTATFTDVDGDIYRVDVLGNGSAAVVTSGGGSSGFIDTLTLTGTDAKSTLRVKLVTKAGDGRIHLNTLSGPVVGKVDMGIVDVREDGSLELSDAGTVSLGDVATGANCNIQFEEVSGIANRKTSFRNVNSGGITLEGFQKSVAFQSFDEGSLFLTRGSKSITSKGVMIMSLGTNSQAQLTGIGSIKAAGIARLNGNVIGSIGSITAASFTVPNVSNALSVSGTIGSIASKGDNAGRFKAQNFGSVSGANFTGILSAFAPDAKGVTFKSIKFSGQLSGQITVTQPAVPAAGTPGLIGSLSAGSINNLDLLADAIGALTVKGGVNGSTITLLKSSGIAIKSFSAGLQITDLNVNTGNSAGITAFKALGVNNSNIQTGFISSLTLGLGVQGGLRSSFIDFFGADAKGFTCKTAKMGEGVFESDFKSLGGPGVVGSITGRAFDTVEMLFGTIASITATGTPGVFGDVFTNATITAFTAPVGKPSIGTLDLRGNAYTCNIAAAGSINNVSVGAMPANDAEFRVTAGNTGAFPDFPMDLSALLPTAKIGKVTITQKFNAASPSFSGGVFVAPAIGDITINGLINTTGINDGGEAFGFGARTFGKVTLKNAAGQVVKPTIAAGNGPINPFAPTSSGRFTIFVYA